MAKSFDPSDGMGVNMGSSHTAPPAALDRHPPTPAQPVALDRHPPASSQTAVSTPYVAIDQFAEQGNSVNPHAGFPAPGTPYVPIDNASMFDPNPVNASGPKGGRARTRLGAKRAAFPTNLANNQPTWMEIRSFKRTGVAIGSKHAESDFKATPANGISHILLPIPSGVGTGYAHSWDSSEVSFADQFVLNAAGDTLREWSDVAGGAYDPDKMKTGDAQGRGTSGTGGRVGATQGLGDIVKGMVAGLNVQAAGTLGLKRAGDVLGGGTQQATGKAAFNESIVHYAGPQFRTFEFSFSLKPMSSADQDAINDIVYFLKVGSMPELLDSGDIGRVYELPLFFKIKFCGGSGGEELQHMNKIAFCALTGFNVKYGGDRFQTFAQNNAPVQTDISMSFKEISLLNKAAAKQGY